MSVFHKLILHISVNFITIFSIVLGSAVITEDEVLKSQQPYFCRLYPMKEPSKLAAIYAENLTLNGVDCNFADALLPENMGGKYNYLAAKFFIVGRKQSNSDVKRYFKRIKEVDADSETDSDSETKAEKPILIRSYKAPKIDAPSYTQIRSSSDTHHGHTELELIARLKKEEQIKKLLSFIKKFYSVNYYGLYIDSTHNLCWNCLERLYEFMHSEDESYLFKELEKKEDPVFTEKLKQAKSIVLFRSKSFGTATEGHDTKLVHLSNGKELYPMIFDGFGGRLYPSEKGVLYHGRLDVNFSISDQDGIYFRGQKEGTLPIIICHPTSFFSERRRTFDTFSYRFSTSFGNPHRWSSLPDEEPMLYAYNKGKEDGEKSAKIEIARNLKSMNLTIDQIKTATGLTEDDINMLK